MKIEWVGKARQLLASTLTIVVMLLANVPAPTSAIVSSCGIQVNPHNASPASFTSYNFTLLNSSAQGIQWIKVTRPSASYSFAGTSISGWGEAVSADNIVWTSNTLNSGATLGFQIAANLDVQQSTGNWTVQVSDDPNGASPTTCSGSTAANIAGYPPNDVDVAVYGVTAGSITQTSTTITWNSNSPTNSVVYYGKTAAYGTTVGYNPTTDYSHSVDVTGLTANTTYHFQVAGQAADGSAAYSADNTFLTAPVPGQVGGGGSTIGSGGSSTTTTTTSPTTATPLSSSVPILHQKLESVPPTIQVTSTIAHIYKTAPTVVGTAQDDTALAVVEYSTDGGLDWLPADKQVGNGGKSMAFSFTPKNLQDGNYKFAVRATDTSGNQAVLAIGVVVIDQLPPIVGGNTMSVGSQFVQPGADGNMRALAGLDQRIVLSAVGGPTSITIEATGQTLKASQNFSLSQSSSTGLWSGSLSFIKGGTYRLQVKAQDGAGNTTSRPLGTIVVDSPGKITDADTHKSLAADISVFYRDPSTKTWITWDGGTYGQSNPVKTTSKSGYSLYLPSGEYYLKVHKAGYHDAITQIFTITNPTPISADVALARQHGIDVGFVHLHVPHFGLTRIAISPKVTTTVATDKSAVKPVALPLFDLPQTNGSRIRTVDVYGQPTIITTMSSWSATSQEQLPILAKLAAEFPELRIMPVDSGESLSKLISQSNVSGYALPIAVDAENSLANSLNTASLPTNYFVNRQGMITKTVIGVLSKEELLQYVAN